MSGSRPEMSCEEFFDSRTLVLKDGRPFTLYPLQRRFVRDVFDTYDAVTGRRCYRQALWSVPKKWGKTTFGAGLGIYHLFFDDSELDREIYSLAGDLDQAQLSLEAAKGMIRRSPMLSQLIGKGLYSREIVFEDRSTGQVHRWKAMASDVPTSHGMDPSFEVVDEGWQLRDYGLLEAISLGPQRRHPLQLWTTYAGLQAQMVEGNPLFDLYQRGQAVERDPALYVVWRSGLEAYDELPDGFIRSGYLDEQRRLLPANKFQRLHLNEWGAGDTAFASSEEIAEVFGQGVLRVAQDRVHPWVLTIDYGRSVDMTALVVARLREDRTIQVGELIVLKGSRTAPVPLETVEQEILALSQRFNLVRVAADQWQMHGSVEKLKKLGLRIVPVTIGPSYLNQITTNFLALLRSHRFHCFTHPEFRRQLESVIVKEQYYGIRIDTAKGGSGVRAHDDMVVAAAMAAQLAIEAAGYGSTIAIIRVGDFQEETPGRRILREGREARALAGERTRMKAASAQAKAREIQRQAHIEQFGLEAVEAIERHSAGLPPFGDAA